MSSNTNDIAVWLKEIGLEKHSEAFLANDIDFGVLPELGENELKELGLSLGDRTGPATTQ